MSILQEAIMVTRSPFGCINRRELEKIQNQSAWCQLEIGTGQPIGDQEKKSQMDPEGQAGPPPQSLPEFDSQTVGSTN